MKRVVGVSIGSSKRDHAVDVKLLGEDIRIERVGTNGDMDRAIELIRELDGKVDAFGLGGMDLYVRVGPSRYTIRDAKRVVRAAKKSPIVDGTGLKDTLERELIETMCADSTVSLKGARVLMVSAADRFGMAESLAAAGCPLIFGDLPFTVGVPFPLRTLNGLRRMARVAAPIITQLPFHLIYPIGERQEQREPKFPKYFEWADWIAGDFHFIRRYMPDRLDGKSVITNTTTAADVELMRRAGVRRLVTTTPELDGRSFGTNVMEAALVAVAGKGRELDSGAYRDLIRQAGWKPRVASPAAYGAHVAGAEAAAASAHPDRTVRPERHAPWAASPHAE